MNKETAIEVLKKIEDPEVMLDIYSLGLIYDITIKEDNTIHILMTLTSPACPYGPLIIEQVKYGLANVGFKQPEVEVTFNPPWQPSEEVQMMLGLL